MRQTLLAAILLPLLTTIASAEWSGNPYASREAYHIPARPAEGADVNLQGRGVPVAPQAQCWLVRSGQAPSSGSRIPAELRAQIRSEFIPFNTRREFESYRQNNDRGQQAQQCAFNMPVTLCNSDVGQTGHRALGTVIGPFTFYNGESSVTLTLRAERQGTGNDYGWSVASLAGTCEATGSDCNDADYAAAHPDDCTIPNPATCDDPVWRAAHPAQCGVVDQYCPTGYTTHVLLGLIPTYYDESGAAHTNPHTVVGCARSAPSLALATPTSCRPSQFQQASIRYTNSVPNANYGFPNIGFCGYDGSLDTRDYNDQWGGLPTFCAHDLGTGWTCEDNR